MEVRAYTYQMLYTDVCRVAAALNALNIKKGDRVALYLPMIPELVVAMLACARIGAVHTNIFTGYADGGVRAASTTQAQDWSSLLMRSCAEGNPSR